MSDTSSRILDAFRSRAIVACLVCLLSSSCGGGGGGSDVQQVSSSPACSDAFALRFDDVDQAELDVLFESNVSVVGELCEPQTFFFSGPAGAAYSIDGGAWSDVDGTIRSGQSVRLRLRSASTHDTKVTANFFIGEEVCGRDPLFGGWFCRLEGENGLYSVTTVVGSADDAPDVVITSPLEGETVEAERLLITGTASDPDGVAEILVNGVAASSLDGFQTWEAEIPLRSGINEIRVSSADSLLNRRLDAAVISVFNTALVLAAVSTIDMESGSQTLFVIDVGVGGLLALDTVTDDWRLVSADSGSAVPLEDPRRLLVDESGGRAWVVDEGYDDLIEIDLATGSRRLMTGAGESLEDAKELAFDAVGNRLFVLSQLRGTTTSSTFGTGRIISLDLDTGERTLLSSNESPPGDPSFWFTYDLVLDTAGDRLLVLNDREIIAVDPQTGTRALFFEHDFDELLAADVDAIGGRLILSTAGRLLEVDQATALSTLLSETVSTNQLVHDALENRLFMPRGGRVAMFDLATGAFVPDFY